MIFIFLVWVDCKSVFFATVSLTENSNYICHTKRSQYGRMYIVLCLVRCYCKVSVTEVNKSICSIGIPIYNVKKCKLNEREITGYIGYFLDTGSRGMRNFIENIYALFTFRERRGKLFNSGLCTCPHRYGTVHI